ncbi:MAG: hypothetical protein HOP19_28520 [Acidobacteria bacterium]|nr:hypothetical protein [Acidobacteriota bacterium]
MKLFLLVIATIILFSSCHLFQSVMNRDRETGAIQTLRTFHNAQAQFQAMKGHFGTLEELADSGLVSLNYTLNRQIAGYVYVSVSATPETYCIRAMTANEKRSERDFNMTEEGLVRYHQNKESNATACGKGLSLTPKVD